MKKYIMKRIISMFLLLLGMTFIIFASLYIAPGDPAAMVAGASATEEDIARVSLSLGLDKPFAEQYFIYLKNLFQFDLGTSYMTKQPIIDEIMLRLPNTLNLAVASMILAVIIGIPCGIITALKKDSIIDNLLTAGSLMGISVPNFWLGTMLIYVFAVQLKWFPSGGVTHYFWTPEGLREIFLPAVALSAATVASFTRIGRSSMIDVLQSDYIRTAKSKGLKGTVVVMIHALRNALIPILTQFGTSFGGLLGGAIITEQVFAINGLGSYLITAINSRNYPVVQSTVLVIAAMFIVVNLIVDLLYSVVDPRIKYE